MSIFTRIPSEVNPGPFNGPAEPVDILDVLAEDLEWWAANAPEPPCDSCDDSGWITRHGSTWPCLGCNAPIDDAATRDLEERREIERYLRRHRGR